MAELEQLRAEARELVGLLTIFEIEVLSAIVAGASLCDIAGHLGMELLDAKYLRECTFEKIGAHATADAVRIGIYAGLGE